MCVFWAVVAVRAVSVCELARTELRAHKHVPCGRATVERVAARQPFFCFILGAGTMFCSRLRGGGGEGEGRGRGVGALGHCGLRVMTAGARDEVPSVSTVLCTDTCIYLFTTWSM